MFTSNWDKYLQKINPQDKDLYFTEAYHKLCASILDKMEAFVYEESGEVFVFPFLSREFKTPSGIIAKDFESAYGYGGPVASSSNSTFLINAYNKFKEEAIDSNYVCGFVRFHPLLDNHILFNEFGELLFDRHTIAIDLRGSEDDIWMSEIHTKNRNVIKKGAKSGLTFEADYSFNNLPQFVKLYKDTMDKLSADEFYYFDDLYFQSFKESFPNSFLGCVKLNGNIIAAAIFMHSEKYGHYHLAGSDISMLNYSPNNFMLWEAAKELKKQDVKLFHLGGGINSDESNSLFQFKHKFSKSTHDFYIGKVVFNNPLYEDICKDWQNSNPEKIKLFGNRLLKYRY